MDANHDLLLCSYGVWYPAFRKVAIPSVCIELPEDFVHYLVSDNIHGANLGQAFPTRTRDAGQDYDSWTEEDTDDDDSISQLATQVPSYAAVVQQVNAAITKLGGRVAPRLNWSSPHDATWVLSSSTLACTNADEVLLLLKSSDRVAHDICDARPQAQGATPLPMTLVLRKWQNLLPEREFRCFVVRDRLVGACQRVVTQQFPQLLGCVEDIKHKIASFYKRSLAGRFALQSFTFDCYVASDSNAVRLLDFNPVGGTTASLLYTWEELGLTDSETGSHVRPTANETASHSAACSYDSSSTCQERVVALIRGCTVALAAEQAPLQPAQDDGQHADERSRANGNSCHRGTSSEDGAQQYTPLLPAMPQLEMYTSQQCASDRAGFQPQTPCSVALHTGSALAPVGADPSLLPSPADAVNTNVELAAAALCVHVLGDDLCVAPTFEVRIIDESIGIRPHSAAYMVPYDFVDDGLGGAVEALWKLADADAKRMSVQ